MSFLQPSFRSSLPVLPSSCPPLILPSSSSRCQVPDEDQMLAQLISVESSAAGETQAVETSCASADTLADVNTSETSPESADDDAGLRSLLTGDTPS